MELLTLLCFTSHNTIEECLGRFEPIYQYLLSIEAILKEEKMSMLTVKLRLKLIHLLGVLLIDNEE